MFKKEEFKDFFTGEKCFGAIGMHNFSKPLAADLRRTDAVTAYHVFLTTPYYCNSGSEKELELEEFELLTAKLSACLWKRYNGPIYMLTDPRGAEYFYKMHLDRIYDGILPILDARNYGINAKKFWASGKIQALTKIQTPCVVLDMDMIVWKVLDLSGCSLAASHIEHLDERLYPDIPFFLMSPRYQFPKQWNYNVEPLNTSFVYFADNALKDYYSQQSIRFMQYERDTPNDGFTCMIFAEQRILAMCAEEKKAKVKTFLDYDNLAEKQDIMTHLWSGKKLLYYDKDVEEEYIRLCRQKIEEVQSASNSRK